MTTISKYKNGNCTVEIFEDGTKTREYEGVPNPQYPESMDVKITNYCDAGCGFCHEMSTVQGQHGDLNTNLFDVLPAGVELALGGGNPLSHPNLKGFLERMHKMGKICNMTVNNFHIKPYLNEIVELRSKRLIRGLGVSYSRPLRTDIDLVKDDNTVVHLIIGVHTIEDLSYLCEHYKNVKVLLLGYKYFGRGKSFANSQGKQIENRIYDWYTKLPRFFNKSGLVLSFDNLAIEQLKMSRFFTDDGWKTFYMGNDGEFSMYIDLVKKEYAKSSFSKIRNNLETDIEKMFKSLT